MRITHADRAIALMGELDVAIWRSSCATGCESGFVLKASIPILMGFNMVKPEIPNIDGDPPTWRHGQALSVDAKRHNARRKRTLKSSGPQISNRVLICRRTITIASLCMMNPTDVGELAGYACRLLLPPTRPANTHQEPRIRKCVWATRLDNALEALDITETLLWTRNSSGSWRRTDAV